MHALGVQHAHTPGADGHAHHAHDHHHHGHAHRHAHGHGHGHDHSHAGFDFFHQYVTEPPAPASDGRSADSEPHEPDDDEHGEDDGLPVLGVVVFVAVESPSQSDVDGSSLSGFVPDGCSDRPAAWVIRAARPRGPPRITADASL